MTGSAKQSISQRCRLVRWIASSQVLLAMTAREFRFECQNSGYASAFSRHDFARALRFVAPRKKREQGMPDARCTRGLVCKLHEKKRTRAYRAAENIRHSLRNGFTAYFALSPAIRICLSPSPRGLRQSLTPGWAGVASAGLDANPEAVRTTRLHRTKQRRRQRAVRPLTESNPPCDHLRA